MLKGIYDKWLKHHFLFHICFRWPDWHGICPLLLCLGCQKLSSTFWSYIQVSWFEGYVCVPFSCSKAVLTNCFKDWEEFVFSGFQVQRIVPKDPDATKKLRECEKAITKIKFEEAIAAEEEEKHSVAESLDYHSISIFSSMFSLILFLLFILFFWTSFVPHFRMAWVTWLLWIY